MKPAALELLAEYARERDRVMGTGLRPKAQLELDRLTPRQLAGLALSIAADEAAAVVTLQRVYERSKGHVRADQAEAMRRAITLLEQLRAQL